LYVHKPKVIEFPPFRSGVCDDKTDHCGAVNVLALSGTMAGQDAASQAEQTILRQRADEVSLRLQLANLEDRLRLAVARAAELRAN
jgi:hypothetical protein